MASQRPDFRNALRNSTAAARNAAVKTIESGGGGADQATFDRAEQVMAAGGLVQPGKRGVGVSPAEAQSTAIGDSEFIEVPIEKAHDNDYNARFKYDPALILQRAAEIARDGQKTPAPAVPHPTLPGEYMLVGGGYRKRALMHLGRPTIILSVRRDWTTPRDRFVQSWRENEERLNNSPFDNAMAWSRALKDGLVATREELGQLLGVSAGQVSKTLALADLPEEAVQKAYEHPEVFTMSTLYEVALYAKLADNKDVLALMDRIVAEGWGKRQIEQFREDSAQPRQRKRREVSRQYKILSEGGQIGTLKENDSGMVRLEVSITDAVARQQLMDELKKRFGLTDDKQQLSLR